MMIVTMKFAMKISQKIRIMIKIQMFAILKWKIMMEILTSTSLKKTLTVADIKATVIILGKTKLAETKWEKMETKTNLKR